MRMLLIILGLATAAVAAEPTTRPRAVAPTTPVAPIDRPTLIDLRQPAFVPKFARMSPPAGPFAEREYATRYTFPVPVYYGFGHGYVGWPGGYRPSPLRW